MARVIQSPDKDMTNLLMRTGDNDIGIALKAQRQLAKAMELPIKQGILDADIVGMIYNPIKFGPGQSIEFPIDLLVPGTERDYAAYTIPNHGRIPERHIEADYLMIPTYDVGSSIDWLLKFSKDARWDVIGRAMAIFEASFIRKNNLDGWQTIIAAAVDRNIIVYDAAAPVGLFTKRLVTNMQLQMRRAGGGGTGAINPIHLTDLFLSPEGLEGMRTWDLTMADDFTRREIFLGSQLGGLTSIFGVVLHDLYELGVGQAYQNYFTQLGGTLPNSDTQMVIGLDLSQDNVFVNPIRQNVEIFEDEGLHRQRRAGYYGWGEHGFAVLDNRRIILGSF